MRQLASAVDDDGVFLADFDTLGLAQFRQRDLFQGQADFFSDDLAAGQDQRCLPAWPCGGRRSQEP
jgi:hypothetical protein